MKVNYNSPYIKWGFTAFVVICAAILFFFAIFRLEGIFAGLHLIAIILMPFVYGLVIAYLLCPIYNIFDRYFSKFTVQRLQSKKILRVGTFSKLLSTTITLTLAIIAVGGLICLVLPQITESLIALVKTAPDTISDFVKWIEAKLYSNKDVNEAMRVLMGDYTTKINHWLQNEVLPFLLNLAAQISTGMLVFLRFIKDMLIGIIICIYFLNSKETFKAQSKKVIFAMFNKNNANIIITEAAFINKTFSGFISGKILDSTIIGIICFIVMSIFNWPYVMLISVIVGVTNIIPFFGPFVGAIPSIIIILTESPLQALYFAVFVLILQQVDGNIIGPKILGDSTGIPSFWVMFAILVGGGLFGFVGMILGIPIFAIIYAYFSRYINGRLLKKNLPVKTENYVKSYHRNSNL